jgi:hypothetical protein
MPSRAPFQAAALLLLGLTVACGESPAPTAPLPPAQPTGTFLLRHPEGILYTLSAGSESPREISRFNNPFVGSETSLLPGGSSVVGMGLANGAIPRGFRMLDLRPGGGITTLVQLGDDTGVFDTKPSPDGRTVAFAVMNWVPGRITLMRMGLESRAVEQLWISSGGDTEFARFTWLPDGSGLVGQLWGLNRYRMAKFDLATRTMTILSDWISPDRLTPTMRLSRDGRTIAYNTQAGALRFITLEGQPAPGFPTDLKGILPAFSPDGKLLAYSKLITEPTFRLDGIWVYRFSDRTTWRLFGEQGAQEPYRIWEVLDWE